MLGPQSKLGGCFYILVWDSAHKNGHTLSKSKSNQIYFFLHCGQIHFLHQFKIGNEGRRATGLWVGRQWTSCWSGWPAPPRPPNGWRRPKASAVESGRISPVFFLRLGLNSNDSDPMLQTASFGYPKTSPPEFFYFCLHNCFRRPHLDTKICLFPQSLFLNLKKL